MLKFTFRPTPPLWAVGECEAYYERMAAKGWLLYKRGVHFDRYRRSEPQKMRYRLEFTGSTLEEGILPLPEEQLQLYEDCGWLLAAKRKEVYVFRTPAENEIPELYSEAEGQTAMLAGLKKHYRTEVLVVLCWVAWGFIFAGLRKVDLFSWKSLAEADLLLICIPVAWVLMGWKSVYGAVMTRRLLNRLKRGEAIDRTQDRKKPSAAVRRAATGLLLAALAICVVGASAEALMRSSSPLPDTGENVPYLLGGEVFAARRDTETRAVASGVQTNSVKSTPTLISPVQYHTNEQLILGNGGNGSFYQNVYTVRSPWLAEKLAWSLADDSVFSSAADYRQEEAEGLDLALLSESGMELVAVKGNTVAYAIYIGFDGDASVRLLEAYARQLQARP